MSRGLWFAAGAGAGIYAVVRGRRAAEALTVDGLGDRLSGLAVGVRMFRDEVVRGRSEKETELRERLGSPPGGPAQLTATTQTSTKTSTQTSTETEDRDDGHR